MTDKMREEFEAWAEANLGLSIRRAPSGAYQSFGVYSAWEAWQASREALVVELPQNFMPVEVDHHSDLPLMHAGAVIAAIEAAGVKVKP